MLASQTAQVTLVIWTIWLTGGLLLAVLSLVPATAQEARRLWTSYGGQGLVVLAATTPFLGGDHVLLACILAMAVRIGYESGVVQSVALGSIPRAAGGWIGGIIVLALALVGWSLGAVLPAALAIAAGIVAACALAIVADCPVAARAGAGPSLAVLTAAYPGLPVMAFAATASGPDSHHAFIVAFLLVEIFDSFALLGGRLFGTWKVFPLLSGQKTLEGLVAGLAALIAAVVFLATRDGGWSVAGSVALIAVAGLAAVFGDLVASWVKRRAGVKDYPPVLSGQGGLLDIVDAWLLTAPVVFATFVCFGL